jgi:hypothetical protein
MEGAARSTGTKKPSVGTAEHPKDPRSFLQWTKPVHICFDFISRLRPVDVCVGRYSVEIIEHRRSAILGVIWTQLQLFLPAEEARDALPVLGGNSFQAGL